jgi:hypothetical protein
VVERCLARDPEQRWQTASDVQRELEWVARIQTTAGVQKASGAVTARRSWTAAIALMILLALSVAWLGFRSFPRQTSCGG